MRYSKEHKAQIRQKILKRASMLFRRDGLAGVGVRRLMSDAGLTHGGFYAHFPSRVGLVSDAVGSALEETHSSLLQAMQSAPENERLEAFIDAYLDTRHRDHPELGCAGAAFAPEVARDDPAVRASFTNGVDAIVNLIALELPSTWSDERRFDRAYAVFSLLMGALQLARTTSNAELSNRILAQGKAAALLLASPSGSG